MIPGFLVLLVNVPVQSSRIINLEKTDMGFKASFMTFSGFRSNPLLNFTATLNPLMVIKFAT